MSYGEGDKCVSFDGDADRIVYFYKNTGNSRHHFTSLPPLLLLLSADGKFKLLDGDKIAALVGA